MSKREGHDAVVTGPPADIVAQRLQPSVEENLTTINIQPEATLLQRVTEGVLRTMFRIPQHAAASFVTGDFDTAFAEAKKLEIRCRTFYIYYPRDMERAFQDEVFRYLKSEVYEKIVSAYDHPPKTISGRRRSKIQALLAWVRKIGGGQPANTQAQAPTPPSPPSGLKKLIDAELYKECKKRGINDATETELKQAWEGIDTDKKETWLHDNVIGCWIRRCPSDGLARVVHIVGRANLYYRPELEEIEAKNSEPIYLAARLKLASGGTLNAHDFNRPMPEYIHIIDTLEDWEFVAGSLRHDNLIIDGQHDAQKLSISDVKWRDGWRLRPNPPDNGKIVLEMLGYKCKYLEYITIASEVGYVPNLRPRGRVLPRFQGGEKHNLLQDAALVRALEGHGVTDQSVLSAIVIDPQQCWLVASKSSDQGRENAWLCYASGQDWVCQKLEHRVEIPIPGGKSFIWRRNDNTAPLPDCFVGELEYRIDKPKPIEITAIQGQLQTFGREEPFGNLHDGFLTASGHLILHSQGRDPRTRALYHLEHSDALSPDLFLIHYNSFDEPLHLSYTKPLRSVSYDGKAMGNIEFNEKKIVLRNGKPLILCGENILLICGTSTLVLNTSSSMRLGGIAVPERAEPVPAHDLPTVVTGWASIENVLDTLRKSPAWADVRQIDRPVGDVQGTYTQGFEFTGKDGARYFVKCYRSNLRDDENYRVLARQEVQVYHQCADLPVVPPLLDALPSEDIPQLLVMPKLTPLEVTGLSLAEILAIGYAMAVLLERFEERRLVHYDIRTTKFSTDKGSIKLIDYNSVFPALDKGEPLQPLHHLLIKSGLPEVEFLSPERRNFLSAGENERPQLLTKIGPASSIYALAKVLLSIRRGADPVKLEQQWEEELGSGHGHRVRVLLDSMLSADAVDRPAASKVKEEMGAVLRELRKNLATHPDVDRAAKLLGPILG